MVSEKKITPRNPDISIDALNNMLKTILIGSVINILKQAKDADVYDDTGVILLITYSIFTLIGYWALFTVYHKDYYNKIKEEALKEIEGFPQKIRKWKINEYYKFICLAIHLILMTIFPFFIFNDEYQNFCYVLFVIMGLLDLLWMYFFIYKLKMHDLESMNPGYLSFDITLIVVSMLCLALQYDCGDFNIKHWATPVVSLLFLNAPLAFLVQEWKNRAM